MPRNYVRVGWLGVVLTCSLAAALLVVLAFHPTVRSDRAGVSAQGGRARARSVIFINGDGMSTAHREAARLAQQGANGQLAMDRLPVAGMQTTNPAGNEAMVTDSAAAATAWATGMKTYNGAISVDVNKQNLATIGHQAGTAGKATGLVTTAQVTDASPAAFFANVPDRDAQDEIARQYLATSRPDVILGGGEDYWYPVGTPGQFPDAPPEDRTEKSRGTKGNLVDQARAQGYQYVTTPAELEAAGNGNILGLFANEDMFQHRAEGQGDVYAPVVGLEAMTRKALDVVSRDEDGFFLFVEEEGVDGFAHSNNGTRVLQAMEALDQTVALARDYVDSHPDTLLIVTGDHDCGGLTIETADDVDESGPGKSAEDGPFTVRDSTTQFFMDWTTTDHTGAPTLVTATGPNSDRLTGVYPNTHVHDVMLRSLVG